ncbi:Imm45 family immunity protein [Bartonella sp. HY329]|uniref:Imm45 family immunity protein n=1 Tax=unclassified Bartonella TaxID=2645622 RepID=UPI0021C721B3|nr:MULTISPECIES: Imm45 family immunity protein [unclassified Bartonella]UXM96223.1 Imm45 family immunity protein [Bartonella sp. HY329]UXN10547.1 Imm45 family immunity protein [Bartonella sp. HY328]
MIKLKDYKEALLRRGNVLRVKGIYPHEAFVDLMIFETQKAICPLGLIVTTGYKAGLILQTYPEEAYAYPLSGIYKHWLVENWIKWGYPSCDIDDVYIIERYFTATVCF